MNSEPRPELAATLRSAIAENDSHTSKILKAKAALREKFLLLILRAILSSNFVKQQIAEKGLLMNGGALRWQAQTLRKVYIPHISLMNAEQRREIILAYENDRNQLNTIIHKLVA